MDIVKAAKNIIDQNFSNGNDDPFFILNLEDVKNKFEVWRKKIPRVVPFYAVKCNDDERVLKLLKNLGAGFDCASMNEFTKILKLNVETQKIIYANTVKQVSHLKLAAEMRIEKMTFDCPAELMKVKEYHPNAKVVLRIRFDASNAIFNLGPKFGCNPVTEAPKLIQLCKNMKMNLIGIAFHVGSGTTDHEVFQKALEMVRKLFDFAKTLDMKLNFVDIGGGFSGNDMKLFECFANSINSALEKNFPSNEIEIIAEPGRYFVDTAFSLAVQVILKKQSENEQMFYYLNESIFLSLRYFRDKQNINNFSVIRKLGFPDNTKMILSTMWGCTCTSIDKIWADVEIPELEINDWLVFSNMGAYSTSVSSTFNGFSNRNIYSLDEI
ncbi:unnamed protein product [Chironomus riparius]|uniref:ornithine decarboxylase n=1 Tax=Chironomus riparius TaxID=315576 RepID=A0A9N9WY22_9DIPT|nr:unnamed protein product [Chironomus riparius]